MFDNVLTDFKILKQIFCPDYLFKIDLSELEKFNLHTSNIYTPVPNLWVMPSTSINYQPYKISTWDEEENTVSKFWSTYETVSADGTVKIRSTRKR